jgi:TRAP-type C4-dicarboxylate transport system permease small subunit
LTDVRNSSNESPGVLNRIEMGCVIVNVAVVFVMMLAVVYGVAARYIFNIQANWVPELSALMMLSLTYLTLGHVQSKRMHVNVTVLIDKLGPKIRTVLRIIATLLSLALFALVTWAAWRFALKALLSGFVSDAAKIPLFPFRLLVSVGGLLLCVRLVADLIQDISSLIGPWASPNHNEG